MCLSEITIRPTVLVIMIEEVKFTKKNLNVK